MRTQESLKCFAELIEKELGIIYADHNYFQLQNRLEEIAKIVGVAKIENLYDLLTRGEFGPYKQLLLDSSTNNETSFFRDFKVFEALENEFLNYVVTNNIDPLRIWSAASSSGQEPISLTILIKEFQIKKKKVFDFTINATDISQRVLDKAQKGIYGQFEVQRGLKTEYLKEYFVSNGDSWLVTPDISEHIKYSKLNLKDPFTFANKFHLVLCRNVLIYQKVEGKKEILKKISDNMVPGGFLVLGAGESLLGISSDFEQHFSEGAVLYRKKFL